MKKIFILITILSACFSLKAQDLPILDTLNIPEFDTTAMEENTLLLEVPYAESRILNKESIDFLKRKEIVIETVSLLYTDYPPNADLSKLNRNRLETLRAFFPEIFEQKEKFKWKLIMQENCKTKEEAQKLPHGFVVKYRKNFAPMNSLSTRLFYYHATGKVKSKDPTVMIALERNKQWKNMLIIADVTGSMDKHVGQLLRWLVKNIKKPRAQQFVFFNDGDKTPNEEKIIGETGGIYAIETDSITHVIRVAAAARQGGNGGDTPENNVEALIFGLERYEGFDEVVMIADNKATPRDLRLLEGLKVPVRIILCGAQGLTNPYYLMMARTLGGSVHTIEQDLTNLSDIKDGDIIKVGKERFKAEGSKFILLGG